MGTLSTPVARNFVYSGIEHEDEVYNIRQLAARDSDADLVKIEKPLPVLVPTGSAISTTDSSQVSLNDEEIPTEESVIDDESRSDDRPFAVTASIFRSIDEKGGCKNDSRKDASVLPKQGQEEKAFVQALKESLEESIKESLKENEPATVDRQDCRQSFAKKTPFIFQVRSIFLIYFGLIS